MCLYDYILKSNKTLLFFWFVMFSLPGFSQLYPGFNSSNFAGISGATHNPASLADNPYRFDVVFIGLNIFGDNNYGMLRRDNPFLNFTEFDGEIIRNEDIKYSMLNFEVMAPSFMIKLKNKASIGFTARVRTFANAKGLTGDLANSIAEGFDDASVFDEQFSNQRFRVDAHSWREFGLSYGWVLHQRVDRKIKAGITAKLLYGNAAAFVNFATPNFTTVATKELRIPDFLLEYGYSSNFDGLDGSDYKYKRGNKMNFGFDLGVQYEYYDAQRGANPSQTKLIQDYNKQTNYVAEYKYRIGLALLDIGRIKYQLGESSGAATTPNTTNDIIDLTRLDGTWDDPQLLEDSLNTMVTLTELTGDYTVGLPTALKGDIDYNLHNGFYLNGSFQVNMNKLKWANSKIGDISNVTITPRWENHWLGFYVPFYFNTQGQFNMGVATHIGPLVLGAHDFLPFLTRKEATSGGVYLMLKTFVGPKKIKSRNKQCGPKGWQKGKKVKQKARY